MSRRLVLCTTLAATVMVTGCTADTPNPPPPPARTFDPAVLQLVAYDSCDRLTGELRAAAKEAVGPWGFGGGPAFAQPDRGARDAVAMPAAAAAEQAGAPAYSGTNVHEQGVDEPDMVKTDGRRIVTVQGGTLRVVDAATRTQTGKLSLDVDGAQTDLLLAGDRALVLANPGYGWHPAVREDADVKRPPTIRRPTVFLIDLSGPPREISRFEGDGTLVDARLTGNTARVVLRSMPRITFPDLPTVRDEEKRVEAHRKTIDQAAAEAWLPTFSVTTGTTTERGTVDCRRVSRPPVFSGTSTVTVHTFDLAGPALSNGDPVSVLADGDTVYGTPTSLYIASDQRWRLDFWPGRDNRRVSQRTEIYRFDTPAGATPVYAAAGTVPGWLINQYALSEWDGHLRVATTNETSSSSAVRVLRQTEDKLVEVGKVDGLGKNERIYSVRFIGPRGYVVTFRQVDPLYSLDLSDPAAPEVTGELKITGYSAHLQPVGENRLVGIGQEADTEGRRQGTQVSLFDVANAAEPRRLAQHHVSDGYSEAEYDPHAILWWPATGLLVIPVTRFDPAKSQQNAGALALRVTGDGLTKLGEVTQPRHTGGYEPAIQRTLVVGDVLWTVSDLGLQASSLSTLDSLAFLPNS